MTEITLEKPRIGKGYEVLGYIGRGTWGEVWQIRDRLHNTIRAGKRINPTSEALEVAKLREQDLVEMVIREGDQIEGASNIVQRFTIHGDNDGDDHWIAMAYHESFLHHIIGEEKDDRKFLGKGLSIEQILDYSRGIAKGLHEVHKKLNRAQCDLNPNNIAVDGLDALICDIGTGTFLSLDKRGNNRTSMGFIQTRAPESYDNHPEMHSDIWSFGSLMYRMITGKYIFEDEINGNERFVADLDVETGNKLVYQKLKFVPKEYRTILMDCLSFNPALRCKDMKPIIKSLEYLSSPFWERTIGKIAMSGIIGLSGIAGLGLLSWAIVHAPKDLSLPKDPVVEAYNATDSDITLRWENDLKLPEVDKNVSIHLSPIIWENDNRVVAAMIEAYEKTKEYLGRDGMSETQLRFCDENKIFEINTAAARGGGVQSKYTRLRFLANHALNTANKGQIDYDVDAENAVAFFLFGEKRCRSAMRAADSVKFGKYMYARYIPSEIPENRPVFQEYEREFALAMMAYLKND